MNTKTPVKNFMSDHVVVADLQTKLSDIQALFLKYNIHHLPVTYDDKLVGIISSYDIEKFTVDQLKAGKMDYADLEAAFDVEKVMTRKPKFLHPDDLLKDAVEMMVTHKFHAIPVAVDGDVAGIITNNDMVRYLQYQYEKA